MNITEFLLARIAEDELRARSLLANTQEGYDINEYAERMIAECAAKRAIIAGIIPERDPQTGNPDYDPLWVIRELAAVYASHPDYQEAWAL